MPAMISGTTGRALLAALSIDGSDAIAVQVLAKHGDDRWVAMCFSEKEARGQLVLQP